MKRNNKKLLTIMLAGMLCAATAGTAAAIAPVKASAAEAKYDLTTIFNSNDAANIKGESGKTAFTLGNGDTVKYTRDLAIQWYTAKGNNGENYTKIGFSFGAINFTSMSFTFQSLPMHATKEEVATNVVKFTKSADGKVYAKVIASGAEDNAEVLGEEIDTSAALVLSLDAGSEVGNYAVKIGDVALGEFTNVGAKYFDTNNSSDDKTNSFAISVESTATEDSVVYLNEINGQSFAVESDGKVKDNTKPVLVVNEEISEFLLGTRFQLDYNFIDVLDDSITTTGASNYYQYNLADTEAPKDTDYTTLQIKDKGTYFMESTVYVNEAGAYSKTAADGYTATTVFREKGAEYVSIKFNPKDDAFIDAEGAYQKATYDLSWYAKSVVEFNGVDYLVFNRNTQGPNYTDEANWDLDAFNEALQAKADKVSGGSNAKIELPSLAWLIEDTNNGYNSLKFTISYKTHSSSSPRLSSNLAANELKLDAKESGRYEFKVFATDAAGNPMYAKVNGNLDEDGDGKVDLVKVTADNVWDLENIPSFSYTISAKGLETADKADNDTLDNKNIGESYTMSSISIVGVTNSEGSEYKLYKLDLSQYTGAGKEKITTDALSKIKYATLKIYAQTIVNEKLAKVSADEVDYAEVNREAYARALAAVIGGDATKLVNIFVEIDEFDDRITEDMTEEWNNSDNKFNWKPASRSFKTAESGTYLILADYWDTEMKYVDHVPAYKLIEVASEKDIIKGETEWLKNNLVSVILFSVAALMLILIIILLLVKPSDETLEDVDEKVIAKRKQATDRNKKK